MALDPDFPANPYVYVLYTHDAEIGGTAPRWGTRGATRTHVQRLRARPRTVASSAVACRDCRRAGNTTTGAEQVLIEDWCQQYPSHSIGTVEFGNDGALYASGGDGASFNFTDYGQDGSPLNPCGDPPGGVGATLTPPTAEGGALRSQDLRTPGRSGHARWHGHPGQSGNRCGSSGQPVGQLNRSQRTSHCCGRVSQSVPLHQRDPAPTSSGLVTSGWNDLGGDQPIVTSSRTSGEELRLAVL